MIWLDEEADFIVKRSVGARCFSSVLEYTAAKNYSMSKCLPAGAAAAAVP